METGNVLAENLQAAMDAGGMKALHLSMESKVGQGRISDILRGKVYYPQINTLMKLANALDVTVVELMIKKSARSWRREGEA